MTDHPRSGIPFRLDDPASELARRILLAQTRRLRDQEDGVVKGEDPEAVHDARVALRRMRSALYFFDPYLRERIVKRLLLRMRQAARVLGPVRDLDVTLAAVNEFAARYAPAAAAPLQRHLETQRVDARKALVRYLKQQEYRGLLDALAAVTAARLPARPALHDVLPGILSQARSELLRYQDTLADDTPAIHLHALRIAFKRYRYLLEFTRYGGGAAAETLIQQAVAVQDHLGELHDVDFASHLAFTLLRYPAVALAAAERAGLIDYGLALARRTRELADQFIEPGAGHLWADWLGTETQERLDLVAAALTENPAGMAVPSP